MSLTEDKLGHGPVVAQHPLAESADRSAEAPSADGSSAPSLSKPTASGSSFDLSTSGPPQRWRLQDLPRVVWRIISFCNLRTVAALLLTSQRYRALAEHNTPWGDIMRRLHLDVLLPPRCDEVFRTFRESIHSMRTLHGVYEFMSGKQQDPSFHITAARLTILPAGLGFTGPISRVTLKLIFAQGEVEQFYGSLRYSMPRTTFLLNTVPAGIPRIAGPSFDVVVAIAKRPWANESRPWFERQQGLTRLILTVSSPGQQRLSLVGKNDIIAVTKRPDGCKHSIDAPVSRKGSTLAPLAANNRL